MNYPITINGTPVEEYRIIPGEAEVEKLAAEEFAKYCEKISGKRPCGPGPKDIWFFIDATKVSNLDGFKIEVSDDQMRIIGGGSRGMMYAVYDVFQKYLGVKYFAPDLEDLGCGGNIPEGEYSYVPPFKVRNMLTGTKNRNADWCIKNKLNNVSGVTYPAWHGSPYKLCKGKEQHTLSYVFNGLMSDPQPCLTDRRNIEKIIEYTKNELRSDPNVDAIHISQNDNHNTCKCDRCSAVVIEEGSLGGPLIRMINEVADAIKDEFPNVMIETFAYQFSRKPPKTKPRDNVLIQFCTIEACFVHPIYEDECEDNRSVYEDFMGWKQLTNNISVWDYVTNFGYYVTPYPNFETIRENMAFFAANGVTKIFEQGNSSDENSDFGELRAYLIARAIENPYLSEVEYKKHMDEFLAAYYGAGWRYVRAYMDIMHAEVKRHHLHIGTMPVCLCNVDFLNDMHDFIEELWDKAEELSGDKIENVRRVRLQWNLLSLCIRPSVAGNQKLLDALIAEKIAWKEGGIDYSQIDVRENVCLWNTKKQSNVNRVLKYFTPITDFE